MELRSSSDHRQLFAALCAERISTWLNDDQAGFAESGKPLQRLRPADIAVLVRTDKPKRCAAGARVAELGTAV